MKLSLAARSLLLFGASVVVLVAYTLLESTLAQTSLGVERLITFLLFVVPAGAGVVLGVLSLVRKEGKTWLALGGIVLNGFFAFFHLLIVMLAG